MTNYPGLTRASGLRKGSSLIVLVVFITSGHGKVSKLWNSRSRIKLLTLLTSKSKRSIINNSSSRASPSWQLLISKFPQFYSFLTRLRELWWGDPNKLIRFDFASFLSLLISSFIKSAFIRSSDFSDTFRNSRKFRRNVPAANPTIFKALWWSLTKD